MYSAAARWLEKIGPARILLFAGFVRAVLICWAEYQDHYFKVKYTDIDYAVFTDAARFVAAGGSPYQRATYRYSPLLAYLLLPNIWLHPAWGKVLFSVSDLIAAGLLLFLLHRGAATSRLLRSIALLFWLFNPYTATISTRGSCDVLNVLLMLGLLACLLYGRPLVSGVLYGLAVHFRIYPVIYGPPIGLFLMRRALVLRGLQDSDTVAGTSSSDVTNVITPAVEVVARGEATRNLGTQGGRPTSASRLRPRHKPSSPLARERYGAHTAGTTVREPYEAAVEQKMRFSSVAAAAVDALHPVVLFGAAAAATFILLCGGFYKLYGREFLQEAFLYHLNRKDPRHNFSPYYYPVYLSYGRNGSLDFNAEEATPGGNSTLTAVAQLGFVSWSMIRRIVPLDEPWRLAVLPQAAAVLVLGSQFYQDLPSAWLLQTWAFVTLNKVITAQYFVWYLSLLPLVLPTLVAQSAVSGKALITGGLVWIVAQLHWLAVWAYLLEIRGRSVHLPLWAAGLVFLAANTGLLVLLTRALRWGLVHRRGDGVQSGRDGPQRYGDDEIGGRLTFLDVSLSLARRSAPGRAKL